MSERNSQIANDTNQLNTPVSPQQALEVKDALAVAKTQTTPTAAEPNGKANGCGYVLYQDVLIPSPLK